MTERMNPDLGKRILKALGLEGQPVVEVDIHFGVDDPGTVYVRRYKTETRSNRKLVDSETGSILDELVKFTLVPKEEP